MWVRWCFARSELLEKVLRQVGYWHRYGFSPVCERRWIFRFSSRENAFVHPAYCQILLELILLMLNWYWSVNGNCMGLVWLRKIGNRVTITSDFLNGHQHHFENIKAKIGNHVTTSSIQSNGNFSEKFAIEWIDELLINQNLRKIEEINGK